MFVNTGLIQAAENEAQLAGVIAHEMSHVVLRHTTNQASKRNLVALPAVLAGALAGNSLLGQLAQIGIGFTRQFGAAEVFADRRGGGGLQRRGDHGGRRLQSDRAGAISLRSWRRRAGRAGRAEQFLSDHPNPGNRIAAMSDEVRQMPRRAYVEDETGQFARVQDMVSKLPAPGDLRGNPRRCWTRSRDTGSAAERPADCLPRPILFARLSGELAGTRRPAGRHRDHRGA